MALPPFKKPPKKRSSNMRAIRSAANKTTEKRLAYLLLGQRLRGWRLRPKKILGMPDFVFPRKRVALFVDGCFWHGCPRCGHIPRTNPEYWRAKIARNRRRDARISRALRAQGYSVLRIWECDLRSRPERCLSRIGRALLAR